MDTLAGSADIVLRDGAVITVDPARPRATHVAIADGRIAAVGGSEEVGRLVGPATETLSLEGRTVLPGFQDAHVHPPMGGLDRLRCDLEGLVEPDRVLAAIAAYARDNAKLPWIRGGAWSRGSFPGGFRTAKMLDRAVPDRPAFLTDRDNHGAWVNSAALRLAGIDASTPDPPRGRIERDATGAPTGMLHESATALVARVAPQPTFEETTAAILLAQAYLHSKGITAWQDACVGEPQWGDSFEPYRWMALDGRLTARVVGALWWWADRGVEEQVERFIEERAYGSVGRFRATTAKIMLDGVVDGRTAALLEPYLDLGGTPCDDRGPLFLDPPVLVDAVTRLDAAGFQVHVHAIGDRAIRIALDAFEQARGANGANDNRHHIAHVQVLHPDDLPRFETLGVVANGQPLWGATDASVEDHNDPQLGPERASWQYPFRSLLDAGARLAFGSDWNVTTADVMQQIEVAVTRVLPTARDEAPYLPEQRITFDEAIHAFTMGSAFVNHLDDVTGSIVPGKLADLCVLDRDLDDRGAGPLGDAQVALTMVEGVPVYSDGSIPS